MKLAHNTRKEKEREENNPGSYEIRKRRKNKKKRKGRGKGKEKRKRKEKKQKRGKTNSIYRIDSMTFHHTEFALHIGLFPLSHVHNGFVTKVTHESEFHQYSRTYK
jgi:hypothetical protein